MTNKTHFLFYYNAVFWSCDLQGPLCLLHLLSCFSRSTAEALCWVERCHAHTLVAVVVLLGERLGRTHAHESLLGLFQFSWTVVELLEEFDGSNSINVGIMWFRDEAWGEEIIGTVSKD